MELRVVESQTLHDGAPSEQGSGPVSHGETARRPHGSMYEGGAANQDTSPMYSFNLSFEELTTVGLEEPQRINNTQWTVTCSGPTRRVYLGLC